MNGRVSRANLASMRLRLVWPLCLAALGCGSGDVDLVDEAALVADIEAASRPPEPSFERYPDLAHAALALLDAARPRVVGFGEYHETRGGPRVASSLVRFRDQILPAIAPRASDLVVETWVEPKGCSEKVARVTDEVVERIDRPPESENQILGLLRSARELGLEGHLLEMSCDDMAAVRSGADVDYEKLLGAITEGLYGAAVTALDGAGDDAMIVVYGGSMHNDVFPYSGLETYSYAERMIQRTGGRFLEIDLFVPELIAGSKLFAGEPWFPVAAREARPDSVLVFHRGPKSALIIARRASASDAPRRDRSPSSSAP